MSQNIPIKLVNLPVPVGVEAADINQLLALMAQYLSGTISANVSFFLQGSNFPTSNQGIFYNQSTNRFGNWNTQLGKYINISDLQVGDVKPSYVAGDDPANGWVVLDGRKVANVPNLTQLQYSNLDMLFSDKTLPNLPFLAGLNNPPAVGTFSSITQSAVQPVKGYIGSLAIDATYTQSQVAALRDASEQLDTSVNNLNTTVATMKSASEQLLASINSNVSTSGPWNKIFVGFQ